VLRRLPSSRPPSNRLPPSRLPSSRRPLVVTADPALLDDLVRLSAAAGAEPDVAADAVAARSAWAVAPIVLVGADVAAQLARARLPRRGDVVLVAADADDAGVWDGAVGIGAESVALLPDAEEVLVRQLMGALAGRSAGVVVSVVGGRGGAGATTTAAALALTATRRGLRAVLLDADPLGGGIDLVLGAEDAPGARWSGLAAATGGLPADALHDALPDCDALSVLSCDRVGLREIPAEAMDAVLSAARMAGDLVVVDLPRQIGPAGEIVLLASECTLLVVPAEVRAAAAAAAVAAVVSEFTRDLRLVVRGPAPAGLPAHAVAESLGLPLAGVVREEPGLAAALERGDPPARRGRGPLARFCAGVLDELVGEASAA
jgi:secretion/DNA translocation related CpaE-like protein